MFMTCKSPKYNYNVNIVPSFIDKVLATHTYIESINESLIMIYDNETDGMLTALLGFNTNGYSTDNCTELRIRLKEYDEYINQYSLRSISITNKKKINAAMLKGLRNIINYCSYCAMNDLEIPEELDYISDANNIFYTV